MSTCYGHAVVAFPGLPPARFDLVEGWMCPRGFHHRPGLPRRTFQTLDGRKIRLSRKERSRLRANMRKWSGRGSRGIYCRHRKDGHPRDFRTLEFSYCDY